jgi:putative phage-type endonuclease
MSLTAEQQAIRSTGIGSSEIGILAGLSRWGSPIDIYERKLGLREEAPSHHLERGTYLEPAIIRWYEARTGNKTRPSGTLKHATLARVLATPDAIILGKEGLIEQAVLEVKAPNHRTWNEWGDPGTDQVPPAYLSQATWEMACAGVNAADVAAIIDGDLAIYHVAYDADLFGELAEIAHRFWVDHIETRTPPSPDGSDSYAESLGRRFPSVRRDALIATPDLEATALAYREAKAKLEQAEKDAEKLKQELQLRMGDAGKLVGSFGSISWSENKGRESLDSKALKAAHPDIAAKFVKQGAPFRTFRATFKGA